MSSGQRFLVDDDEAVLMGKLYTLCMIQGPDRDGNYSAVLTPKFRQVHADADPVDCRDLVCPYCLAGEGVCLSHPRDATPHVHRCSDCERTAPPRERP